MEWVPVFDLTVLSSWEDNKPQRLIVQGKRICMIKRGSELFAIADSCPHQHESLSKGHINYLGEIICPLHQYRFNMKTGRECLHRTEDAETFPVRIDANAVFLGI